MDDPTTAAPEADRERWEVSEPMTIDIADASTLSVALVTGAIDVIGRDEPGARIEIRAVSRTGLEVTSDDGEIRIRHRSPSHGRGAHAEVAVAIQREAVLDLQVVSAAVLVSGLRGGQRVETTSGEVAVDATVGGLRLESVSGEIAVRNHTGDIELRTVSGDVTASGDVGRFRGTAVSGEVFLDLDRPNEIRVDSVSGDVTARLGPARGADYEIATVSGGVHLDGADIGSLRGTHHSRWDGPERPSTTVRVRTASGSVRIVHADRA